MAKRSPNPAESKTPAGAPDESAALISGLQHSITRRSPASQDRWTSLKRLYDAHLTAHARARIGGALQRVLDPEEVVDEAWMRVFESWDAFEYGKKHALRAWLCQQVDRAIIDRCRREQRRPPEVLLGGDDSRGIADVATPASGPATVVARNDRREQLVKAIDGLPEIYRRALRAVWLEEKPRDQVAKDLDIKPNTLTVQLKRGMDLLREKLDQETV